jgi:hypothetical protein
LCVMKPIATFPAIAAVAALSLMQSPAQSYSSRAWSATLHAQMQREEEYRGKNDAEEPTSIIEPTFAALDLMPTLAVIQTPRLTPPPRLDSYHAHAKSGEPGADQMRGNLLDIHA